MDNQEYDHIFLPEKENDGNSEKTLGLKHTQRFVSGHGMNDSLHDKELNVEFDFDSFEDLIVSKFNNLYSKQ
jgi:hypothetical protein